jgi:hypothetical protein
VSNKDEKDTLPALSYQKGETATHKVETSFIDELKFARHPRRKGFSNESRACASSSEHSSILSTQYRLSAYCVSHAVNKASLEMCDKCLYAQSMLEKKDKR